MTAVLKADFANENEPRISVTDNADRERLAGALREVVGDTYMLLAKTQGYHWNVSGPLFLSIHELTESQYRDLFEAADDLAERARALGEAAPTSYAQFARTSVIEDDDGKPKTAGEMVDALATDNERCARRFLEVSNLAEDLGDKVTEDMAIARMRQHEQNAWMLRATSAD